MNYLIGVWKTDWVKVVNALVVGKDDHGNRSVDLPALIAFQNVPLCQIEMLSEDPRGQAVSAGELNAIIAERRRRKEQRGK